MEKVIKFEDIRKFAYINDAVCKKPIKGIAISFLWLGDTRMYDKEFEEEVEYQIVGSTEANSLAGKISNESPLGKALMGRKVGDNIEVNAQAGVIEYEVLKIDRIV